MRGLELRDTPRPSAGCQLIAAKVGTNKKQKWSKWRELNSTCISNCAANDWPASQKLPKVFSDGLAGIALKPRIAGGPMAKS
jgi:hypothetical protein